MTTKLTPKQEKFCQEYQVSLNATQAAIKAGYSERTANEQGARLLANVSIQERLKEIREPLQEATKLTQEWVLRRFEEISNRCMSAVPVLIKNDEGQLVESGEYKFDSTGANKATEMIGKHIGFFEVDNKQRVVQAPVINVLPPSQK